MTIKTSNIVYEYDNHMYTAEELIDFANSAKGMETDGNTATEISDVSSAIKFLNDWGDESVEVIRKYAEGGIVGESIRDYFESVDLSKLPTDVSEYIQNEILNDPNLNMVDTSDEDFVSLKELLDKYKISSPAQTENETIIKLKQEISDLTELMDMEDDQAIITKLKQEINDLNELIDLEQ